jgi:NTP pyrophosphatase (non-canonical NTP hydrolase)
MSFSSILREIANERHRQKDKWGSQLEHTPIEWCAILTEEVGEVSRAALENHFKDYYPPTTLEQYRKELIQVAAVAIAMIEALDAK